MSSNPHVLMLLGNNPYPQDPRPRREAETLVAAGYRVTIAAPRDTGQPSRERIGGVDVIRFRVPIEGRRTLGFVIEHVGVTVACLVISLRVQLRTGFDVMHVHNPPDSLGLVAVLWRLVGKRFVYDHHDLTADMYDAKLGGEARGLVMRGLRRLEGICCREADHILAANESHRRVESWRYGAPEERISVVRNGTDPDSVRDVTADPRHRHGGAFVVCYAGVIGRQDGVDHLVRAIDHVVRVRGRADVLCIVIGDGDGLEPAKDIARELGIEDNFLFLGRLTFAELAAHVAAADVCVEPAPSNPYNDRSTAVKLLEYLSLGKPVVAFDLPEHRVTGGAAIRYVTPNDDAAFGDAIVEVAGDTAAQRAMAACGLQRAGGELRWDRSADALLGAYAAVTGGPR